MARNRVAAVLTPWPVAVVLAVSAIASGSCGSGVDGEGSGAPGWGQPEALGKALQDGALAGDGLGSAVAVWNQPVRTGEVVPHVVARRFAPGTGWTPLETIDLVVGSVSFQRPAVAMDAGGSIVVGSSAGDGLYARRFVAGRGWGASERISPSSRESLPAPALKLDAAGNGLAVWSQSSALWAARFEAASGWSAPTRLPESGQVMERVLSPALAVNAKGDGLAIWAQGLEGAQTLWASAFTPGTGWSRQARVDPGAPLGRYGLSATLNAGGQGLVLWTQDDPRIDSDDTLVASRYQPGEGFAPPEALGRGGSLAASLDPAGNAIVFSIGAQGLRVHRYAAGRGWEPPELLEGVGGYDSISVDANGNGWILWANQSPDHEIWSRRLVGGRAADPLARVALPASGNASQVRVVADAHGGAVALWFEEVAGTVFEREWTLVANRFVSR